MLLYFFLLAFTFVALFVLVVVNVFFSLSPLCNTYKVGSQSPRQLDFYLVWMSFIFRICGRRPDCIATVVVVLFGIVWYSCFVSMSASVYIRVKEIELIERHATVFTYCVPGCKSVVT